MKKHQYSLFKIEENNKRNEMKQGKNMLRLGKYCVFIKKFSLPRNCTGEDGCLHGSMYSRSMLKISNSEKREIEEKTIKS